MNWLPRAQRDGRSPHSAGGSRLQDSFKLGQGVSQDEMPQTYPRFIFFPRSSEPPPWVGQLADAFRVHRDRIDTVAGNRNESNAVLAIVRPELKSAGYEVEEKGGDIPRPVLFGEGGMMEKEYRIDAYHPQNRVVLEVEAGRGAKGNAVHRDLINLSLIVGADYAAIAVPIEYRFNVGGKVMREPAYRKHYDLLDAIYSSGRLKFPFHGVVLLGY